MNKSIPSAFRHQQDGSRKRQCVPWTKSDRGIEKVHTQAPVILWRCRNILGAKRRGGLTGMWFLGNVKIWEKNIFRSPEDASFLNRLLKHAFSLNNFGPHTAFNSYYITLCWSTWLSFKRTLSCSKWKLKAVCPDSSSHLQIDKLMSLLERDSKPN